MITIISISLALLVIVAGLLLLAKTKKDELGGLFTFSSYAIITCGILLTAFAFVGSIVKCHSYKGGGCGGSSYSQCNGGGGGGSCATYGGAHHKKGKSYNRHGKRSCSKGSCCGGGYSKSSCSKGSYSCNKDGKYHGKSSGKRKEIKKIIKTKEDGEEEVNVTI